MTPSDASPPAPPSDAPAGSNLRKVLLVVAAAPLVLGAMYFFDTLMAPDMDGRARVALGPQPVEATFTLAEEAVLDGWADIDVRHRGISHQSAHDSLPHVVDYVVEFTSAAGQTAALRCNPFNTNFARRSGDHSSIGEVSGRYYDARLRECAVRLTAGTWTLRAWREPVGPGDPRIRFDKSELVLRAR